MSEYHTTSAVQCEECGTDLSGHPSIWIIEGRYVCHQCFVRLTIPEYRCPICQSDANQHDCALVLKAENERLRKALLRIESASDDPSMAVMTNWINRTARAALEGEEI